MTCGFLFMAGGRPRVYETPEELQIAVDGYFSYLTEKKEPATVTGLALHIGFESRQSIYDYEEDGEFSYIIKNARLRVECEYEKRLTTAQSPTGAIFALKNMGWKDKTEQEIHGAMPVTWNEEKTYQTKAGE
jgi:hypothetical protein